MYVIFTNFDEVTLDLDGPTEGLGVAALDLVRLHNVPIVLFTEKTAAEARSLRMRFVNAHPFIIENGAAVYIPRDYFDFHEYFSRKDGLYDVIEFERDGSRVMKAILSSSKRVGSKIQLLSDLSDQEVADLTGVTVPLAARVRGRRYTAGFTCKPSHAAEMIRDLTEHGLAVSGEGPAYMVFDPSYAVKARDAVLDMFVRQGESAEPLWLDLGLPGIAPKLFDRKLCLWRNGAAHDSALPEKDAWRSQVLAEIAGSHVAAPPRSRRRILAR